MGRVRIFHPDNRDNTLIFKKMTNLDDSDPEPEPDSLQSTHSGLLWNHIFDRYARIFIKTRESMTEIKIYLEFYILSNESLIKTRPL